MDELDEVNMNAAAGKQTNMKGGAESCATLGLKLNYIELNQIKSNQIRSN